jgi:hypothetical protein
MAALFSSKRMSTKVMLQGHLQATLQRAASTTTEYLIAVQDTTFYNYSGHTAMKGLGKLQGQVKGILQHNVLLLDQGGLPLGLVDQQYWSRQGAVPYEGTESEKWTRGLQAVNEHLGAMNNKVVLVQDREADILSFFKASRAANVELLVRVHQPRQLEIIHSGQLCRLGDVQQHIEVRGHKQVEVVREGKTLQLRLSLQSCRVHVLPDKDVSVDKHKTQPLSLVIAREIAALDEQGRDVYDQQQAAEWYLLSSMSIEGEQDIERVVDFYALRWRIERLHYTLKSGALKVERLQFDDVQTTIHALAFYSVVGWQLLSLTYQLREDSQADATKFFEQAQIRVLEAVSKKRVHTVEQATIVLSSIVGFSRSKKQPLPGVRVLAQALERLYYIKKGYEAAAP